MDIRLKLTTPTKEIERMMLEAISEEYNKKLQTIAEIVAGKISFLIIEKITDSDIYRELVNGKLKSEFGLVDAEHRVQVIIRKWVESISFKFDKVKPKIRTVSGGFRIDAIPSDFSDVITLAESTLFSQGGEVPWLRWLLIEGYKNLIADYTIQYGNYARSRTDSALMRKSPGRYYKIPNEYAGMIDDNWITRIFDNIDTELEKIIVTTITGVL
jgi:hypothetical protein